MWLLHQAPLYQLLLLFKSFFFLSRPCIVLTDLTVCEYLCVCVCVSQASMMFSSGIFWTGLVFIPITSLVFDVAYKV